MREDDKYHMQKIVLSIVAVLFVSFIEKNSRYSQKKLKIVLRV
ncbi:MAG: hypothetical protein SPI60_06230 [Campylobacter lanienae]|nr:hypothetical protein [Campylobacter lanienae]